MGWDISCLVLPCLAWTWLWNLLLSRSIYLYTMLRVISWVWECSHINCTHPRTTPTPLHSTASILLVSMLFLCTALHLIFWQQFIITPVSFPIPIFSPSFIFLPLLHYFFIFLHQISSIGFFFFLPWKVIPFDQRVDVFQSLLQIDKANFFSSDGGRGAMAAVGTSSLLFLLISFFLSSLSLLHIVWTKLRMRALRTTVLNFFNSWNFNVHQNTYLTVLNTMMTIL